MKHLAVITSRTDRLFANASKWNGAEGVGSAMRRALLVVVTILISGAGLLTVSAAFRLHGVAAGDRVLIALAIVVLAAVLAMWVWSAARARALGALLYRARWSGTGTAVLIVALAFYTTASFVAALAAMKDSHGGIEVVEALGFVAFALFTLVRLWRGVELHELGLVAELSTLKWDSVQLYEWMGDDRNKLHLRIDQTFPWLWWNELNLSLATDDLDVVDRILREHLGSPWSARDELYRK